MEGSNEVESPAQQRPVPVVQVGRAKLKGVSAVLTLLVVLTLVAGLVIYEHPRPSVVVSAVIWLLLDLYWSIAEVKPRPAKTAESQASRKRHGLLTTASLLQRVLELPGGEALRDKRDREDMIDFIKKSKEVKRRANLEQKKGAKPIRPVEAEDDGEEIVIDGDE